MTSKHFLQVLHPLHYFTVIAFALGVEVYALRIVSSVALSWLSKQSGGRERRRDIAANTTPFALSFSMIHRQRPDTGLAGAGVGYGYNLHTLFTPSSIGEPVWPSGKAVGL